MDLKEKAATVVDGLNSQLHDNIGHVSNFFAVNENVLFIAGWSSFVGVCTWVGLTYIKRWRDAKKEPDVELKVAEMKKRAYLDQMYADAFGDALFDLLYDDKIDRHEYKRACRRFGIAYSLSDLLVRKNKKRGMKHRVKHNIAVMHRTPSVVGKIPGPKPGADVPVVVLVPNVRKTWVATGKAMLRRKSA